VARENAQRYRQQGAHKLASEMERMAEQLERQAAEHVIER
jgi:hypothetical protein